MMNENNEIYIMQKKLEQEKIINDQNLILDKVSNRLNIIKEISFNINDVLDSGDKDLDQLMEKVDNSKLKIKRETKKINDYNNENYCNCFCF